MARIIRALPGYGDIPAHFPVIVDDGMAIIEPAFAYLHELATIPGRSHAAETIRTYSEHLHDWLDSLEQSRIAWDAVGEREIAAWRNRMLERPSPHTKRPYGRSTINDRVRTVCRFYGWAHQRSWIAELPFHYIDVRVSHRRQSMLAHLDVRPGVVAANVLTVPQAERLPRALRADQLRRLFSALAAPYDLMASWALVTGMRRKELCALELFQVPETVHLDADEHPLVGIGLSITKGVVGTGHWLRHCYAMTMLAQLQRQARTTPEINPLKVVQVLLGHRSIASTAIYLRCVEMHGAELEESIAWLYGALIDDG